MKDMLKVAVAGLAVSFATACSDDDNTATEAENDTLKLSDVSAEQGSANTCVLSYEGFNEASMTSFDVDTQRACLAATAMSENGLKGGPQ